MRAPRGMVHAPLTTGGTNLDENWQRMGRRYGPSASPSRYSISLFLSTGAKGRCRKGEIGGAEQALRRSYSLFSPAMAKEKRGCDGAD